MLQRYNKPQLNLQRALIIKRYFVFYHSLRGNQY
jgi:hypothetical protein